MIRFFHCQDCHQEFSIIEYHDAIYSCVFCSSKDLKYLRSEYTKNRKRTIRKDQERETIPYGDV